jgi:hypothetical protein
MTRTSSGADRTLEALILANVGATPGVRRGGAVKYGHERQEGSERREAQRLRVRSKALKGETP